MNDSRFLRQGKKGDLARQPVALIAIVLSACALLISLRVLFLSPSRPPAAESSNTAVKSSSTAVSVNKGHQYFSVNPAYMKWPSVSHDPVWYDTINLKCHQGSSDIIVEVGVLDGQECSVAGLHGCPTFCFEPAPQQFKNSYQVVKDIPTITLVNAAVSDEVGKALFDASNEQPKWDDHLDLSTANKGATEGKVEVPVVTLDHYFGDKEILLAKIDTQGFDGHVLTGMKKMLQEHRVKIILMELWPKAMKERSKFSCREGLMVLAEAGYEIYPFQVLSLWKGEPDRVQEYEKLVSKWTRETPLEIGAFCKWLEDGETTGFGLWTDIYAIVPDKKD